jgi:hypothetical protein
MYRQPELEITLLDRRVKKLVERGKARFGLDQTGETHGLSTYTEQLDQQVVRRSSCTEAVDVK